jgi:hypothetical protein
MRRGLLIAISAALGCSGGHGARGENAEGLPGEHDTSSTGDSGTGNDPGSGASEDAGDDTGNGTSGQSTDSGTEGPGTTGASGETEDASCERDCPRSGQLVWEHVHGSGLGEIDEGWDVAMAPDGTFHVVGYVHAELEGPTIAWRRKFSAIGGMLSTQTHAGPGTGNNQFRGAVVDDDGNLYVAGYENVPMESANAWIRRHAPDGSTDWTVTYDGPNSSSDVFNGLTRDAAGNLLVVGYHNVPGEGHDVFLRKMSPAGNVLWTRSYTGAGGDHDIGWSVSAADDGHFFVVGYVTIPGEGRNMWLGKYDTDGNLLWERAYNGAAGLDDELRGVAAGPSGEVYVCGFARPENQHEIFVRRYDASGIIEWTDLGPGESGEGGRCFGMARDLDDNLVVVGDERIEGVRHLLVRKYDPDGEVLWSTLVSGGAGGPDYGRDVTITPDNEILVTGTLDQGTDARDVWVGRFTP